MLLRTFCFLCHGWHLNPIKKKKIKIPHRSHVQVLIVLTKIMQQHLPRLGSKGSIRGQCAITWGISVRKDTTPIQWSRRFLGIITGWDPSVCKSNRLHVDSGWRVYQLLDFEYGWLRVATFCPNFSTRSCNFFSFLASCQPWRSYYVGILVDVQVHLVIDDKPL